MEKQSLENQNVVKTMVQGKELAETKERMINFFTYYINMDYIEGKYPHWHESVDQLMEVSWVLWKWHAITDPKTGRPMKLKTIATLLCRNLHRRLPHNISGVAHQSMRTRRKSVVDYYAYLWRLGKIGIGTFVDWEEPITWPKITSYRGLFK